MKLLPSGCRSCFTYTNVHTCTLQHDCSENRPPMHIMYWAGTDGLFALSLHLYRCVLFLWIPVNFITFFSLLFKSDGCTWHLCMGRLMNVIWQSLEPQGPLTCVTYSPYTKCNAFQTLNRGLQGPSKPIFIKNYLSLQLFHQYWLPWQISNHIITSKLTFCICVYIYTCTCISLSSFKNVRVSITTNILDENYCSESYWEVYPHPRIDSHFLGM